MTCKNNECRAELPDDAIFCLKCGTKQDSPSFIPTTENLELDLECETQQSKTSKTKSTKAAVIIILSIAIIAFFILIGWCIQTTYSNANENTNSTEATYESVNSDANKPLIYEYSLESCPIKIHKTTIEEITGSNKLYLSIQWSYENSNEQHVIDEVIFSVTGYKSNGEAVEAPRLYPHSGPVVNNDIIDTCYEQSWIEDVSSIKVDRIKIVYADSNTIEIYFEPVQETTTNESDNNSVVNTLENCPIKVTSCYPSTPNSADGVDLHINWYSEDTKEIKYIYFYVTPYNRVNDRQTCEIRDYSTHGCYVTGPFSYGSSDYSYWDCIWYNSDIDHVELDKIVIKYMDGTSEYYY